MDRARAARHPPGKKALRARLRRQDRAQSAVWPIIRRVRVVSKKYDGSLRDEYETFLFSETDEQVILFSPPGTPFYDYRKAAWLAAQDGLLEIYFKRRWYNLWHIAEQYSRTNLTYVNISLPAALDDGLLTWVDLDLDYRVHLDGSVERLDEEEFAQNTRRFGYPPDLVDQALAACREVEAGLAQGSPPFDYQRQVALYWRIKADNPG
jgi:protein associated with RNAse G/E